MRIVYTYHAEAKLQKLKAEKNWVEETILWPDKLRRDDTKFVATKKLNGLTLEVIFEKQSYIKVITLYYLP